VKFEHTRLDLAEIEDFVDHIEEVGPRSCEYRRCRNDDGRFRSVPESLAGSCLRTDYRVERGPQLMADRAEEGRFRALSGVGLDLWTDATPPRSGRAH
jgi:hypothetical protein